MLELSQKTICLINKLFEEDRREMVAEHLKKDCSDNLPFCDDKSVEILRLIERIQFAAIRLSNGNLNKLLEEISLAQQDWRDLLVAADFANQVNSHETWADSVLYPV